MNRINIFKKRGRNKKMSKVRKKATLKHKKKHDWTSHHDELLHSWHKQASINFWLQMASNYYYGLLNAWLAYPSIILSTATSIGVFGMNGMTGKYITAVMALMSAILIGILRQAQAAEKAKEFILRAKDFYILIREIDYLLATEYDDRETAKEIMSRLRRTFDRIVDMSLDPPIHIIRSYEKRFRPLEASLLQDLQTEMGEVQLPMSQILRGVGTLRRDGEIAPYPFKETQSSHLESSHPSPNNPIPQRKSTMNSLSMSMPLNIPTFGKKYDKIIMTPYQLYTHPVTMTTLKPAIPIENTRMSRQEQTITDERKISNVPSITQPQVNIEMNKLYSKESTETIHEAERKN
jgi:hypothetical protein